MENMKKEILMIIFIVEIVVRVECCNEAVCNSIVNKCLLTKACSCDLSSRACSKGCFSCLGYSYTECCDCLNLCPKDKETPHILGKKSHVEDYFEALPELFNVLTEQPDEFDRWNVMRISVGIDMSQYSSMKQLKIKTGTDGRKHEDDVFVLNCTVVFWSQCISWRKCKSSCLTMGSSSYRWFHDGCCECIGQHCINYGINESRCRLCPLSNDARKDDDTTENELDYGEDDYIDYDEDI